MLKISIIIPTLNEAKVIEDLLKSIKKQSYKNIEIILVDSPRTIDKTAEIAKRYTNKVYKKGPERSSQRNYGAEIASGQYLLMLDADMLLTENVVEECVKEIEKNKDIKTITIPEKSIGTTFWSKCKAFERNFYYIDDNSDIEAARFIEKKAFEKVGGYDINITGPEDWDLPERINEIYPIKKKIKAHIIHNEEDVSLLELMKKKNYYAKKANVYMKKHKVQTVSSKTIYFLRPTFYKNWKLWFKNPIISIGTIIMLTCELFAGGIGFLETVIKTKILPDIAPK